jgi:hypothetical protein
MSDIKTSEDATLVTTKKSNAANARDEIKKALELLKERRLKRSTETAAKTPEAPSSPVIKAKRVYKKREKKPISDMSNPALPTIVPPPSLPVSALPVPASIGGTAGSAVDYMSELRNLRDMISGLSNAGAGGGGGAGGKKKRKIVVIDDSSDSEVEYVRAKAPRSPKAAPAPAPSAAPASSAAPAPVQKPKLDVSLFSRY